MPANWMRGQQRPTCANWLAVLLPRPAVVAVRQRGGDKREKQGRGRKKRVREAKKLDS